MTPTTPTITPLAGDAGRAGPGTAPGIAALITEAPVPQPTLARTFAAMGYLGSRTFTRRVLN